MARVRFEHKEAAFLSVEELDALPSGTLLTTGMGVVFITSKEQGQELRAVRLDDGLRMKMFHLQGQVRKLSAEERVVLSVA